MRVGTPGFVPERLIEARKARGLTFNALGEMISINSTNISRWEKNTQSPEQENVFALSKALELPVSFFMNSMNEHGSNPMFFRSRASATKTIREKTEIRLRWAQDISLIMQNWLDLPEVNLPRLNVTSHLQISNNDIEKIAAECRKMWNMGFAPISDVLLALENAGVIVVKEEVGAVELDGLSNWSAADNRPYIYIAKDKDTCCRSRLDAAHELGHLVLHHSINSTTLEKKEDFKEIERQAYYFAGAFLMPAESFGVEVFSPSLSSFAALKERWKVSIAAMISRSSNLGLISDNYKLQLWKYYSARGWRKGEPLDDVLIPESPRLLSRCIKLLIDENVKTKRELISELRLNTRDIENITGSNRGYFDLDTAEIIPLSIKNIVPFTGEGCQVVSFNRK